MSKRLRTVVIVTAVAGGVMLASTSALAGTGLGGVFNLGVSNTVNAPTTLTGSSAGKQLQVTNTSTSSGATGLGIKVSPGKPPLTVNSTTQVANLNASLVDGKSTNDLVQGRGTILQTGLISMAQGTQATLLTVPGFGQVTAQCGSDGSYELDLNANYDGNYLFAGPHQVYADQGAATFNLIFNEQKVSVAQMTTSLGDVASFTSSSGTVFSPSRKCDFSVQVVVSHA